MAQQAVDIARATRDAAAASLPRLRRAIEDYRLAVNDPRPLASVPALTLAIGIVERKVGAEWVPLDPRSPLQPGETIRTGPGARAVILFYPDKSIIQLDENSYFLFRQKTKLDSLYEFLEGRLHISVPNWFPGRTVRIRTSNLMIAVRATEFDLHTDATRVTRLIPYSGKVELTADTTKIDRTKLDKWWEQGQATYTSTEVIGKTARIVYSAGDVTVVTQGTTLRAGITGHTLLPSDIVRTADKGFVRIRLFDGYEASLSANAHLEGLARDKLGKATLLLHRGQLYLKGREKRALKIQTPTALVSTVGGEMEIRVGRNDVTDVALLEGSATVDAVPGRVEIHGWWKEI